MVSAGSMPNETGKNKYTENETDSATVMSGSSDNEAHLSVDQPSKSKSSNLKGMRIAYLFNSCQFWIKMLFYYSLLKLAFYPF